MPKLLIVTTVAATLRAFLLPYAEHFRKLGWRVDALANGAAECAECLRAFDRCCDVPFSRRPLARENRAAPRLIRDLVAAEKYDIVHVHTPVASFITRFALRRAFRKRESHRPKVVYTAHGFHFHENQSRVKNMLYAALEKLALSYTDHVIVINKADYDAALALCGGKASEAKERVSLFPGIGIDIAAYSPDAVDGAAVRGARACMGLGDGDVLFLMVAEFNKGKRHQDAIRALAATGRPDFHLAFAGTGPREQEMRRLAAKLGVSERVHFLGHRSDVPALMLASRATILTSEREGLNRSVMESICLGVPVLGARARGISDLVTGSRGDLFDVGDYAALAADMILSAANIRLLGLTETPKPDPLWDIGNLLNEHETLYARLLGR
ncbi:MAG: glycosyltransferase [Synergistaceae bacterium]|jgi:glycosyltransferase involved in cell wall biosynthesis|nr:glycosyltransferase [Synergistaceae bacterium]